MNKKSLVLALLTGFALSLSVFGDPVDVQLDRSQEKFNLGISDFWVDDKNTDESVAKSFYGTVSSDLKFSKLFNLLEKGPSVRKKSDAFEWKKLGSDMVLTTSVRAKAPDQWEVNAKLFDTSSGKEVLNFSKKSARTDWRTLAHDISNEVVKSYTGQLGIFNSKIVFANDLSGRKELYIGDYDGKNLRRLTNDNSIVVLPRMSPDGKKILFTSYVSGNPVLYVINRDGTGRRKLSSKAGLNVSPSWAPSSEEFAITLSMDGAPNIYLMDTNGQMKRRLTDAQGADTAPSFSPDGNQFSFTSDRAGAPHIYIVGTDGSGLRRITTASHCDSSAWSPDGQTILYVKGEKSSFDIYSIEVLTGIERRLTWGTRDSENPAWSPDGRFILFVTNRRGKSELFIMTADGSDPEPLPTNNGQSFTPHWSN